MAGLEPKAPTEVRNYTFDWSEYLGADTIAASNVTVSGVTLASSSNTTTAVTVIVSGGTIDTVATITNTITTAGGLTETETFTLPIRGSEPVSLAEAKANSRVTDDSEDALIESYIRQAREWVEDYTGRILVRRTVSQPFTEFWPYLELHHYPFVSVTGIDYVDADGAGQEILPVDLLVGSGIPVRIRPADAWPSILTYSPVTVNYVAGYGEGEVPAPLIRAILVLVEGMRKNRGGIDPDTERAAQANCIRHCVPVM